MTIEADYLVIGSGVAGLSFALEAAKHGTVAVITKREIDESNTRYAQGGIAAVMTAQDSFERHAADTMVAGAGLCRRESVKICVEDGPRQAQRLIDLGIQFTLREQGNTGQEVEFDLGKEGGHRFRRVLHAGDITGNAIQQVLVDAVKDQPNISVYEHHIAINLITDHHLSHPTTPPSGRIVGAYVLDRRSGQIRPFAAHCTLLASGGLGKVYLYTSNPDVATGDGIAMAYRVGAKVANMEFIQFHPTCLYHPKAKNFLISEALRGEGGELINAAGDRFMSRYHELKSLAPRDIVTRAIDNELKRSGDDCVFLDMTHLPKEFIQRRFPNIHATCLQFGVDMTLEPIPVVPACHYSCGGVQVGLFSETSLPGLLAAGEVACTGLHGANRLASNSLLEGLVFSCRAAAYARRYVENLADRDGYDIPPWDPRTSRPSDEAVIISQNWDEIRRFMWNYVGVVRTNRRLFRAKKRIELMAAEIREYYWDYHITADLVELRNLATVARIIIESALRRRESRGLHYNMDYPERDDQRWLHDTVVDRLMLEGFK
ncbi:MAG: L-aspartate oxidase [Bradymonadales bacterium]|nr:L-aspartate oxidase [Bradymonadales bacterium]